MSEETVLTDATGLHLGAGPYFLIYSRAMSQEEEDAPVEWPEYIKVSAVPASLAPSAPTKRVFDMPFRTTSSTTT